MLILAGVLALTVAVEVAVWSLWCGWRRRTGSAGRRSERSGLGCSELGPLFDLIVINALTNPAANLAHWSGYEFAPIEATVIVVETVLLRSLWRKSWGASLAIATALNVASGSLSLLL